MVIIDDGITYFLPAPYRHHHVLRMIYKQKGTSIHNEQGFLDNNKVYVSRQEALTIALQANQILDINSIRANQLFSEDLW